MSASANEPLEGLDRPAAALEQAMASGRMHHAWLLAGPEGVGKASLAHRAARLLLGAKPERYQGPLGSAVDDPVAQLIAAQAHPDLLVLERRSEDGKLKKSISVEDARRLPEFFAKTPAVATWRVAIIDSADDLNPSSANALLKTLEEPSGRGVLFLISHAPGSLLPTIRSRCRRLRFPPWPAGDLAVFAERRLALGAQEAVRLAALAGGAPGRLLSLHETGALEVEAALGELIADLPQLSAGRVQGFTDGFRGGEGAGRFALATDLLAARVAAISRGIGSAAGRDRWAAAWQRMTALAEQVELLNLDRADVFQDTLADLRAVARIAPC